MKKLFIPAALTAGLAAGAAQAVEVTGGYVDLGYSSFTDSDLGDKYNLNGSGEVAFTRSFSVQLDLGGYRFQDISETGTNVTLHANYHTGGNASLGAFYGQDSIDSDNIDFYGIEAGFDAGEVDIEGYLGRQEIDGFSDTDGTLFGLQVGSFVAPEWELTANYDLIDNFGGFLDVSTFSVGANYVLAENAEIYGEVGTARLAAFGSSTNKTFVGLGVRMNLGNARGTTFGRRGVLDKLPGL